MLNLDFCEKCPHYVKFAPGAHICTVLKSDLEADALIQSWTEIYEDTEPPEGCPYILEQTVTDPSDCYVPSEFPPYLEDGLEGIDLGDIDESELDDLSELSLTF